ncbi:MAG: class I SAM-dependent methyltransferase, partial [Acidimicrobiales bacterium]
PGHRRDGLRTGSRPAGGMSEHFARLASRYDALRRTDCAPVAAMVARLESGWPGGDGPLSGGDVATGTGRYAEALLSRLPAGSFIVPLDRSAEMLVALGRKAAAARGMGIVQGTAEALPLRPGSLDFLTCFNAVHHLDAEAFVDGAAGALRPGGWLFIYTRTPEQNARTIWGRNFPGFPEHETRLLPLAWYQEVIGRHAAFELHGVRVFSHSRVSTPEHLRTQVTLAHYSTFSLYEPGELQAALEEFLRRVGGPIVSWADENLLVTVRRS